MNSTLSSKQNILVVDDDPVVLLAIQETLLRQEYNLVVCRSAQEALEQIEQRNFAVILSDQRMPEMTGLEFFHKCRDLQPHASRILITGVLTLNTVIEAVNKGEIFRFIAKPWIREELLATVQNAVQRNQLLAMNDRLRADTLRLNERLVEANASLQANVEQLTLQKTELDKAHQALQANFDHSLELCYRLVDAFHPVLGRYTKSVVTICQKIAQSGELDPDDARVLTVSAWLNNIGMIGLPRALFTKSQNEPGTLTPQEIDLLQHHTIYGQTLASFVDQLYAVGETIRASHERFDGSGYPDGLSREAIPIAARYLAVVIAYVESNLSREMAIEEILRQSGRAFDPDAVRLFLKISQSTHLPYKVREVTMPELRPGMMLAAGIYSPAGLLLIPEDRILDEDTIAKIHEHNHVDPITHRLMVYKN